MSQLQIVKPRNEQSSNSKKLEKNDQDISLSDASLSRFRNVTTLTESKKEQVKHSSGRVEELLKSMNSEQLQELGLSRLKRISNSEDQVMVARRRVLDRVENLRERAHLGDSQSLAMVKEIARMEENAIEFSQINLAEDWEKSALSDSNWIKKAEIELPFSPRKWYTRLPGEYLLRPLRIAALGMKHFLSISIDTWKKEYRPRGVDWAKLEKFEGLNEALQHIEKSGFIPEVKEKISVSMYQTKTGYVLSYRLPKKNEVQ